MTSGAVVPVRSAHFPECFPLLHSIRAVDIVYRDLKPENLLLTSNAHLKITDFGFAKRIPHSGFTYTFCGTPEYICPEIVKHSGYGIAVRHVPSPCCDCAVTVL